MHSRRRLEHGGRCASVMRSGVAIGQPSRASLELDAEYRRGRVRLWSMSKQTVVAVVAMVARCLASADASADPTCPAAPLSDATTLHKLHVEVQAADGSGPMLAASTGSVFPAESVDGKAIVTLFADTHDLSGSRISTVVFWSSTGKRLDALRI